MILIRCIRKPFLKLAILSFFIALFCLVFTRFSLADLKLPKPQGCVNDAADMLSSQTESELERKLQDYEKQTTKEIAVVTVENLQGTTVEDFAVRLFEKWKIGKKDKDNGILLLIAKSEREMRIEVGYGLEPILTDGEAYGIIVNNLRPKFQQSDFDGGVEEGVGQIIKGISGEELPEASPGEESDGGRSNDGPSWGWTTLFILFWVSIIGSWVTSILARSRSWWAGGALGAVAGLISIIILGFFAGLFLLFVLAAAGLIFDYFVSKNFRTHKRSGKKPSWWAGGWWGPGTTRGGFGGSSGGFGGFGGGSSGGGGASGGW